MVSVEHDSKPSFPTRTPASCSLLCVRWRTTEFHMSSAQPPRTLTNCPELGRRRHWKVSLRANDQGRITQLVPESLKHKQPTLSEAIVSVC